MATKVREPIPVATPNSSHPNPLISLQKLRELYSMMLQGRLLDERARILEKQAGFENNQYSSVGLEATAVGAAVDLRPADTLAPSHCDFVLSYLKGAPLTAMFSQLYGRNARPENGRSFPEDRRYAQLNIVLVTSTIAAQLEVCIDIAFANQRGKNDNVVMAFSGEGSIPMNDWHDALRFAGRRNLPIVFVSQSQLSAGSVSVDLESAGDDTRSQAGGYGFPGITVDGNDVVAVYRVAQEAIERARAGGGPTLIEAQTFPGYVSGDPIAAMERYLTAKGLFSDDWKKQTIALFQRELDAAVDVVQNNRCG